MTLLHFQIMQFKMQMIYLGNSYYKLEKDNDSLTYQISLKDEEINNLKKELSIIVAPKQEREIFYD